MSTDLRPVLCVPEQMPTDAARGLLPDVVPHRDAPQRGRAALLVERCQPGCS